MKVRGIPLPLSQSCRELNKAALENDLKDAARIIRSRTRIGLRCGMNKVESEFSLILEARRIANEITQWRFESVKLRLGNGCWYVPDFFIERLGLRPLFIEIKGFMRDDARVKFLAAQELHRWAMFEMWSKSKNGWKQIL